MSVLAAKDLSAGYGKVMVVRDLNLDVAPGEVVALLGRNGAGKTTSLLTLAGVMAPMAGQVWANGKPTNAPLHQRVREGMALVTDDRSVFFGLTARENLRLGRGPEAAVLEQFPELEPVMDTPAGLLSGGQQQMLTVGRALAAKPSLLLVDELSLGLAPLVVQRLLAAIRGAADRGAAVLLVEQYARLVLGVVDRAYLLVNGRVAVSGTGADMLRDLADIDKHYLATPD